LFFGILNILVGFFLAIHFGKEIRRISIVKVTAVLLLITELIAFVFAERILNYSETLTYNDHIIFSTSSPYQRIVLTKNKRELRLFLNGNLQFSSADEYRYHEALIHPGLQSLHEPKNVLVLGGGDGLAVREIIKYPSVSSVTLVDLDSKMTKLFTTNNILLQLNNGSLKNAKVKVQNEDAFIFLKNNRDRYDFIVIDFPDPSNFSIGKLYSNTFYRLLYQSLSDSGVAVVQSTSPYVAPKSFWCIDETIRSVGFHTAPYHNLVPSFGEWGYILAFKRGSYTVPENYLPNLKFVNPATAQQMFVFPQDMRAKKPLAVNKLNNQVLVNYFEEEWNAYLE
jgi:spermidine synthase